MEKFIMVFMVAVLIEALTEYIKLITKEGKGIDVAMVTSLVVGLLMAVLTGIDAFALLGLTFAVPYVGVILTGIILSRGSNYLFDMINRLKNPVPDMVITNDPNLSDLESK